ncbi:MAG: hypothetical protein WDO73_09030 [Ignavibacteriota bacterium]
MALSEEDKRRIREEETFRLQVRDELRRGRPVDRRKMAIFWIVLVAVAGLLCAVVRRGA